MRRGSERGVVWVIPFVEKHASLVALFLPLVAVMMIHTDMAELVEYRYNGRISSAYDFHVGHVPRRWGHPGCISERV